MSTSKHIDVICIVAVVLTLLVTILFMNGEKLGIRSIPSEDTDDAYFTANDRNGTWSTADATQIVLNGDGASVTGNGAYYHEGAVHIIYSGKYVISGTLDDGSILVDADSDDKVWIMLDGASITCGTDAAIRVEQAKKVFLTLAEGSENTIASGESYSGEALESGVDGAIFSREDLTINGSGALTVTAAYQHGIVCNDDFVVTGGTIDVTAAEDAIHANDSGRFRDMTLRLTAGDDGITVSNDEGTGYIYMLSGSVTVSGCYEGMEAVSITVEGGDVDVTCSDDGLNANGGSESLLRVTGGNIRVNNSTGRDADGFDSNGNISIEGGSVFISIIGNGNNGALDCGTENGGVCTVSGGTVIACGGSSMAEGFDGSSAQCSLLHVLSSTVKGGTELALLSADGTELLRETIPNDYNCVVLSTPEMRQGETVTLACGDTREEIELTETATSNSTGGFGDMGGFGGGFPGRSQNGADASEPAMPDSSMPSGGDFPARPQDGTDTSEPSGSAHDEDASEPDRQSGGRPNTLLTDDAMLYSVPDVESQSETDSQNGFGRMRRGGFGGESFSFPDGERPSMPSFPDGEMPSMPDGEMPSFADGEMPSMPDGGFPDMQGGRPDDMRGASETQASEEEVNAALQPQTWIWVGVSALVLLAGLAFVLLFKDRSDSI